MLLNEIIDTKAFWDNQGIPPDEIDAFLKHKSKDAKPEMKPLLHNFKSAGKFFEYKVIEHDDEGWCMYVIMDEKKRDAVGKFVCNHKANYNQIDIVQFNPKYSNQNLATAFYKWVLERNRPLPLMSDKEQTIGGRKIWRDLANYPGIHVFGWDLKTNKSFDVDPEDLDLDDHIYGRNPNIRLVAVLNQARK